MNAWPSNVLSNFSEVHLLPGLVRAYLFSVPHVFFYSCVFAKIKHRSDESVGTPLRSDGAQDGRAAYEQGVSVHKRKTHGPPPSANAFTFFIVFNI